VSQYATLEEFADGGLPPAALEDVGADIRTDAIEKASGLADSYLAKRFTLPLISWGDALTRAVIDIAACDLLMRRGFNPSAGSDQVIVDKKEAAIDWLKDVAKGLADPIVEDSTPNIDEAGPLVLSEEPQDWMLATGDTDASGNTL
jgi:phage gp36-like protein